MNLAVIADFNIVKLFGKVVNPGKMRIDQIKITKRIIRNDQSFSLRTSHLTIDQDYRSRRVKGFVVIFRMIDEYDITRANPVNLIGAENRKICLSHVARTNERS